MIFLFFSRLSQSILSTSQFSWSPASLLHVTTPGHDDGCTATTGSLRGIQLHPTTTGCCSVRTAATTAIQRPTTADKSSLQVCSQEEEVAKCGFVYQRRAGVFQTLLFSAFFNHQ